jgi:hypothetical protein
MLSVYQHPHTPQISGLCEMPRGEHSMYVLNPPQAEAEPALCSVRDAVCPPALLDVGSQIRLEECMFPPWSCFVGEKIRGKTGGCLSSDHILNYVIEREPQVGVGWR